MSELDLIYGPDCVLKSSYGKEPFRILYNTLDKLQDKFEVFDSDKILIIKRKLLNSCRKLYMLHGAGVSAIKVEHDFIVSQDRECPALIWEEEIELLYHLEAMVLFARSSLDLGANIFANLMLEPFGTRRMDSFNDFSKFILKTSDEKLGAVRELISEMDNNEFSWLRLLCGSSKGRALRDKIAHQTIILVDYFEAEGKEDKEYCHVVINNIPFRLELFIHNICLGVYTFFFLAEETMMKILNLE
ncbi:MAG: hypothetical protein ACPKPY_08120 [Nitrososphaeraceae archaeon]